MPQRVDVVLNDEEREVLERWARRPKSAQALALALPDRAGGGRRRAEQGHRGPPGLQPRRRWAAGEGALPRRGIDGLHDEPRPGKPRQISDEDDRAGDRQDPGGAAAERDPLVDALDGGRRPG